MTQTGQPAATRGWFGEPWWSFVCYDEAGQLLESSRVPFPVGQRCVGCSETFAPGDSGERVLTAGADGLTIAHIHKECHLRSVLGSVAHLEGRCSCRGGADHDDPGLTPRQAAIAVWEWVTRHGTRAA